MKIGLFDSGIGGLNVLKEFINRYPGNHYIYYGDTLNVPYGEKSKEELLNLSSKIIEFFEEKKVSLIIIACGTVSSTCLEELRKKTTIPIFDIINPTINHLKREKFKNILVFGTKRTIASHIFKNNLDNIVEVATPEFVIMLENNNIDTNIIKNYIDRNRNIDALVLGCTHYPLLIEEFKKYLDSDVSIIDMGKVLVDAINLNQNNTFKLEMYFTKIDDNLKLNINKIIKSDYLLNLID